MLSPCGRATMNTLSKMNIFKSAVMAAAITAAGVAAVSCTDHKNADNSVAMQSYRFDGVAVLNPDSVVKGETPSYVRTSGRGVLPAVIGSHDIKALRDSLTSLACVDVTADGVASAANTAEYTPIPGDTVTTKAESFLVTDLSVSLMTPTLIVWRNYTMGYTDGAAHGRYNTVFVNYSVADNKILSLADLMQPGYDEELLGMVRDKLKENPDLIVPLDSVQIPSNFEVTADGINLWYATYEVAPYSAGEVTVDFSFYELADMLTPGAMKMLAGDTVTAD